MVLLMKHAKNSKLASESVNTQRYLRSPAHCNSDIVSSGAVLNKRLLPELTEDEELYLEGVESVNSELGFKKACFDSLVSFSGI